MPITEAKRETEKKLNDMLEKLEKVSSFVEINSYVWNILVVLEDRYDTILE